MIISAYHHVVHWHPILLFQCMLLDGHTFSLYVREFEINFLLGFLPRYFHIFASVAGICFFPIIYIKTLWKKMKIQIQLRRKFSDMAAFRRENLWMTLWKKKMQYFQGKENLHKVCVCITLSISSKESEKEKKTLHWYIKTYNFHCNNGNFILEDVRTSVKLDTDRINYLESCAQLKTRKRLDFPDKKKTMVKIECWRTNINIVRSQVHSNDIILHPCNSCYYS